ncbi:hypothetical protein [Flavobacterium ustbae]|uniref:hypothetical protein n=1 Tax=Flavobacterium ustbae TaxID=2488790 RepID=UPI000F781DA8|nr:hypothetical protein [Flavobacterium ustbae]
MKVALKLIFCFFLKLGFSQEKSKVDFEKLYVSEKKYSMMFNSNWHLQRTDSLENKFILLNEKRSLQDNFTENIVLLINNLGANVKSKTVKKIIDQRMKIAHEIISNREVVKNGIKGQEIIYKDLLSDGNWATILQYFFVKNKDLYILTFCTKPEEFLDYMPFYQQFYLNFDIR